jgi:hypothetical protein
MGHKSIGLAGFLSCTILKDAELGREAGIPCKPSGAGGWPGKFSGLLPVFYMEETEITDRDYPVHYLKVSHIR